MRILHTSDWHLGKRLFKLDRAPEHALFLDWLLQKITTEKIDVLLIAGDIFDTPTPPHQSLETFYNFLHRLSIQTTCETLMIAGNHDSGLLLEAPSKILAPHRVKVWGKLSTNCEDHWTKVGNIDVCAIPFFRSFELLPKGEGDALLALKTYLTKEKNGPQLLMLHHLAGMYEAAGSEQVINLSGVDSIPSEILHAFDYVALGHIHKPQKIGAQSFYSGSPIPLRFSETAQKSVVIIEEKEGKLSSHIHPIPIFRNLFIVKTSELKYQEDLEKLRGTTQLTPMVEVQIQMTQPKTGLIDEIKTILESNGLELLSFQPVYQIGEKKERRSEKLFELSPLELLSEFYAAKFPEAKELPEDLKSDFSALLDKVQHAPRSP
jgi:DNA repair protein SbcD/Mre11